MESVPDEIYKRNLQVDLLLLKDLKGLSILGDRKIYWDPNPRIQIQMEQSTKWFELGAFIRTLPSNFEMVFFDHFYPQKKGSDHGAIVFARQAMRGYRFKLGNHGWQSKEMKISKIELIDYLYRNRNFNQDRFEIFRRRKKETTVDG